MIAKLVIIVGISVAAVVGMFFLGKFMDGGDAEDASAEKRSGAGA